VKPVRIVVASGPGSGDDFATRVLAERLSVLLGQPFIVENRPGAGGVIGQTAVLKSPPDGYMLLLAGGSMAGARFVNAAATYDVLRDFTQISLIETSPFALVASSTLPAKNVKEFIALARSQPGKLSYGTIGAGQIPWWAVFLFNHMAGVNAVEVVYKDTAGAMTDVMTGRLDYFVSPLVGADRRKGQAADPCSDRRDALAAAARCSDRSRSRAARLRHAGLAQHHGPGRHAGDVVAILNKAIQQALASPELRDRFIKAGSIPPGQHAEQLRKRYELWMGIFEKDREGRGRQAAIN
jgi:tripartite-type tricarboxylate transporter receptor subunit TctC